MRRFAAILVLFLTACTHTTPRERFIATSDHVRLHVLDWGGNGDALVLLRPTRRHRVPLLRVPHTCPRRVMAMTRNFDVRRPLSRKSENADLSRCRVRPEDAARARRTTRRSGAVEAARGRRSRIRRCVSELQPQARRAPRFVLRPDLGTG